MLKSEGGGSDRLRSKASNVSVSISRQAGQVWDLCCNV